METVGLIIVVFGLIAAIMVDKKRKLDVNEKIVELRIRLETAENYDQAHDVYMEVKSMYNISMNSAQQFMVKNLLQASRVAILQMKTL